MRRLLPTKPVFLLAAFAIIMALPVTAFAAATITIVNIDGPGEGFNDPTRARKVGGNPGKTIGEQRLIAFQFAADIWGTTLDSNVEIRIQASFDPLACTANSAVLGSAGAIQIVANFPGQQFANTWYHVALANKLAGTDLIPGSPGTSADDIRARFNSNLASPIAWRASAGTTGSTITTGPTSIWSPCFSMNLPTAWASRTSWTSQPARSRFLPAT